MSIVDIHQTPRLFAAFLLLAASCAGAEDWQDQVTQQLCLRWQAIAGADGECEVSYPGLSPNFRLPECQQAFTLNLLRPLQSGRNGLELSCESPWWRQNLAIQLHIFKPVVVLARASGSHQVLNGTDLSLVRHDIGTLPKGFFTSLDQVAGMQLRRSLRAGTILSTDLLEASIVINRGDQVKIRIIKPGIRIESEGSAMEEGRVGERIRVRNDRSGKVLTARVLEHGLVQVE